jgi:hypothetical protein
MSDKDDAAEVVRMAETAGYKVLMDWIDSRIANLTLKILSGQGDVEVSKVDRQKVGAKLDLTIVSVTKDKDRHEVLTWNALKAKIAEYENLARS